MNMKEKNKKFLNNKGVTGIDLTISIIVLSIFAGLITSLMSSIYKNSLEIQKSANAMAYATMILEKIDEKSFNEIDESFATRLINSGEIDMDTAYNVNLAIAETDEELLKKVIVQVSYDVSGEQKVITINKLKIKEMYRE